MFARCMPWVQLYVNTCNGWPQFALQHHWLLPINCHFLRLYSAAGRGIAAVSSAIQESDLYLFYPVPTDLLCGGQGSNSRPLSRKSDALTTRQPSDQHEMRRIINKQRRTLQHGVRLTVSVLEADSEPYLLTALQWYESESCSSASYNIGRPVGRISYSNSYTRTAV